MKKKGRRENARPVEVRQKRSAAAGGWDPFSAKQHVQSVEHNQPIEYSTMCIPNVYQRTTAEPKTLPTPFNVYVSKTENTKSSKRIITIR